MSQPRPSEGVGKINLFSDAGQYNPSVVGGGASRAVPEAAIHQQPNRAAGGVVGSAVARKLGEDVHAVYQTNQTNPGIGGTSPATRAWQERK